MKKARDKHLARMQGDTKNDGKKDKKDDENDDDKGDAPKKREINMDIFR